MATAPAPHFGPWTEQDLPSLPDDGQRYELLEGSLVVSPQPSGPHQWTAKRLVRFLDDAAPPGLGAVEGLGVRIAGGTVLVPDVLVAALEAIWTARPGILDPGRVHLVVEIVSPSSASLDRIVKPDFYAQAGIPSFWRVELGEDGPTMATFRLGKDGYVNDGSAHQGQPLVLPSPFPIRLDPAALAR